ncbi:N-lysine methyltransferase KMT5A-A [Merluccius polli]|uniref:N-lysine methyltransferase KMT5A-A n=1 Tax=Merluccius polli TaxID=89951 RepID=A0AA47N6H1_MERPO|nr:N-lysine methyltransferase KMT5A-A [Merluccius polli]
MRFVPFPDPNVSYYESPCERPGLPHTAWTASDANLSRHYPRHATTDSASIDAAKEDGSIGRLVNDDHRAPNSRIKLLEISGGPNLCLFATKDIQPGTEITYNYGGKDLSWRKEVRESRVTGTPESTESLQGGHMMVLDAKSSSMSSADHVQSATDVPLSKAFNPKLLKGRLALKEKLQIQWSDLQYDTRMRDLSGLMVSPAMENTLSDGVEDACTHRKPSASPDSRGRVSLLFHHHGMALSLQGMGGMLLYSWIS